MSQKYIPTFKALSAYGNVAHYARKGLYNDIPNEIFADSVEDDITVIEAFIDQQGELLELLKLHIQLEWVIKYHWDILGSESIMNELRRKISELSKGKEIVTENSQLKI